MAEADNNLEKILPDDIEGAVAAPVHVPGNRDSVVNINRMRKVSS